MKLPLVSIVMLAYNAEKYLKIAVESVLNQTYSNIELVFVDNKSTDATLKIIKDFAKNDRRVKIVRHDENLGQAQSRHDAIKACNGEYISFVDSDDWIELDFIEKMFKKLSDNNGEIVWGNLIYEYTNRSEKFNHHADSIFTNTQDIMQFTCRTPNLWMGIFKAELFNLINWELSEKSTAEDALIAIQLASFSKRAVAFDYFGYHYRQRKTSITNMPGGSDTLGNLLFFAKKYETVIQKNAPELRSEFVFYYVGFLLNLIPRVSILHNRITFFRLKSLIREYIIDILFEKRINLKFRIYALLAALLPWKINEVGFTFFNLLGVGKTDNSANVLFD